MLGQRMQYACRYWKGTMTLEQAQENELGLICRKLHLETGHECSRPWGRLRRLTHFLASEYGCRVVSYNISGEQVTYGREWYGGLPVRFHGRDVDDAFPGLLQRLK
jgi:cyclopropane-fatty-acyl-phospholipid synthase